MNNKKGFTLVEILTVIAIMAIILLIAIPSTKQISLNIKDNEYDTKVELILSAAKIYGGNNQSLFGSEKEIEITVRTLISESLLKSDVSRSENCNEDIGCLIDPRNNMSMNDVIIILEYENGVVSAKLKSSS